MKPAVIMTNNIIDLYIALLTTNATERKSEIRETDKSKTKIYAKKTFCKTQGVVTV